MPTDYEIKSILKTIDQEVYLNNLDKMKEFILGQISQNISQEEAILFFSKLKENGIVSKSLDKDFGKADKMWRSLLQEYSIPNFRLWS